MSGSGEPVLGEDERAELLSKLGSAVQTAVNTDLVALYRMTEDEAGNLAYRIVEHVLPLVAQARADGAAEERERIMRLLDAGGSPILLGARELSAADWAVRIIRESS